MWHSKEAKKFFIAVAIILFVTWWLVPSSRSLQKGENAPVKKEEIQPVKKAVIDSPAKDQNAWNYRSVTDKMSGKISKYATKESLNTVNFDFPYDGEQRGTIMLLQDGVLFFVKKGQVVCQGASEYGKCLVRVKIDDEKDKYIPARISGDKSTTIHFGPAFLKSIKKAGKLMIQPEVYQNGYPIFTFDLSGYNPEI